MIQGIVRKDYEHNILYWKPWMVKQKILEHIFGIHEQSFQNMPRMLLAIKYSNMKMMVTWDHKMVKINKTTFKRAFWAFDVSVYGF